MNREQFRSVWSISIWILIIGSIFVNIRFFGIDPFFIVLPLIFLRNPVANLIFGKPTKSVAQSQTYPANPEFVNHQCTACGFKFQKGDQYCQNCGNAIR